MRGERYVLGKISPEYSSVGCVYATASMNEIILSEGTAGWMKFK